MTSRRTAIVICAVLLSHPDARAQSSAPACAATGSSMTPASWRASPRHAQPAPTPGLSMVREMALPGPANRFDYQSVDPGSGRIYMNHMDAGTTIVFDADSNRVIGEIKGLARATRCRTASSWRCKPGISSWPSIRRGSESCSATICRARTIHTVLRWTKTAGSRSVGVPFFGSSGRRRKIRVHACGSVGDIIRHGLHACSRPVRHDSTSDSGGHAAARTTRRPPRARTPRL